MDSKKMDIVMDVKVSVTVQLGTAELPMKEVVELSPGAQIQLKQNAKDPVSLLVNGKLIAHGEVVVIDDRFGLKILRLSTQLHNSKFVFNCSLQLNDHGSHIIK